MLNVDKAFELLADRLRTRRAELAFLAVTAALERWVQFELLALIDANRQALGIDGATPDGFPRWWIACEHQRLDVWVADHERGYGQPPRTGTNIELKALHNNKNLYDKVAGIRRDLTPQWRALPVLGADRCGILVTTYAQYDRRSASSYPALTRTAPEFWAEVDTELADTAGYPHLVPLERVGPRQTLCDLSGAHYVDAAAPDLEVSLMLVREKRQAV